MKEYQIAAVEDNAADRAWLSMKLEQYCKQRHIPYVLSCFSSGEAFLAALKNQRFQIVFMDIYLNGISGVETAQALRSRDQDSKLVFLTSSEDFMRQGFSLNSAHYLIKPVKDEDFAQAMENCRVRRECQVPSLGVTIGQQSLELDTRDILYLDIEGRTVVIHTVEGTLPAGRSFSAIAELLLTDERFLPCNRGLLVNMDFIADQDGSDFLLLDGTRLPMARRRKHELLTQYRSYVFGTMGGTP